MKIVIALTASSYQMSGVQRHGINLIRCLLTRQEVAAVHVICASWQLDTIRQSRAISDPRLHLHIVKISNTAIGRNIWYYLQLPKWAAELKADIVHFAYPIPACACAYQCPTVVTLHDLYPYDAPENFGFPKVLFNEAILRLCLRSANAIACVSQCTLNRLKIHDVQCAHKARVICNSVEPQRTVSVCSPIKLWFGEPFLLCVAQHRANKNILFLLRVFKRLILAKLLDVDARLVIVGISGPDTAAIQRFLMLNKLKERVALLSGISDEELQWCYRNCSMLVAPSLVEGFGLPVAEALLAGSCVVCSDIPAFREIGGNYCEYVALDDQAERKFADAIYEVLKMSKPDAVSLPQLSLTQIAEQYIQLYSSLLNPISSPCISLLKPRSPASGGRTSI